MAILVTGGTGYIGSHTVIELYKNGYDVVIVDAAAIIESGFTEKSDYLVVVHAPTEIRRERIIKRDGISKEDALLRINAQPQAEYYIEKSKAIQSGWKPGKWPSNFIPNKMIIGGESKDAILETGYKVKVPIFVEEGDSIVVSTETGEYATNESLPAVSLYLN